MKIDDRIEIAAPVSRVWDLTVDVEAWPMFTPTMTKVERLDSGPFGVGSQARVKQPRQRATVWTVTAFEPQKLFVWSARSMGMTMTGSHALAASDTGTSNTLAVDIEGELSKILGGLLRRPIAKSIGLENQGFKKAAEAD